MASIWGFHRGTGKYIHRQQTWGALQTTSILEIYFQNRRRNKLHTSGPRYARSPELGHEVKHREGKYFVWLTWKAQASDD